MRGADRGVATHGPTNALARPHRSSRRTAVVAVLGAIAGALCAFFAPWQLALIVGWLAAAVPFVASSWVVIGRYSPGQTRSHATIEDNSRASTGVLLLSASVASLFGVIALLVKANETSGTARAVLTAFAPAAVVASWAVVHAVFTLRYANEYYTAPIGGIDFKTQDERPDYLDFAYVAATVGMTFQVSDTDIQSREIRRTVLRHALLSYVFGAVIIALTINILATTIS
jgi:uncharacterized membrane protein